MAKNVRTTEERPAEGEEENDDGRPRDETKAKAAGAVEGRGREEGLQTAGGRAGVRRASEKERRGGERALLLHFQGKGLTKARDGGTEGGREGGRFLDIIAGFLRHCPNLPDLARYKKA